MLIYFFIAILYWNMIVDNILEKILKVLITNYFKNLRIEYFL